MLCILRCQLSACGMTINCPSCGYDLSGQTTRRCPECGEAFDWEEVRRLIDHAEARARRAVRFMWVAPGLLLGTYVVETFLASASWTVALLMMPTVLVALAVFGVNAIVFAVGVSTCIDRRVRGYVRSGPNAFLVFGCVVVLFGVPVGLLAAWELFAWYFIINPSAWP